MTALWVLLDIGLVTPLGAAALPEPSGEYHMPGLKQQFLRAAPGGPF